MFYRKWGRLRERKRWNMNNILWFGSILEWQPTSSWCRLVNYAKAWLNSSVVAFFRTVCILVRNTEFPLLCCNAHWLRWDFTFLMHRVPQYVRFCRLLTILDQPREKIMNCSLLDLIHPDDLDAISMAFSSSEFFIFAYLFIWSANALLRE